MFRGRARRRILVNANTRAFAFPHFCQILARSKNIFLHHLHPELINFLHFCFRGLFLRHDAAHDVVSLSLSVHDTYPGMFASY